MIQGGRAERDGRAGERRDPAGAVREPPRRGRVRGPGAAPRTARASGSAGASSATSTTSRTSSRRPSSILARKAAVIPWRESVGGWLCAVAHRLAMDARSDAARQRRRETSITALADGPQRDGATIGRLPEKYHPLVDPSDEIERRDLRRLLDDELLQLAREVPGAGRPLRPRRSDPRGGRPATRLAGGLDVAATGSGTRPPATAVGPSRRIAGDRPARLRARLPRRLEHALAATTDQRLRSDR